MQFRGKKNPQITFFLVCFACSILCKLWMMQQMPSATNMHHTYVQIQKLNDSNNISKRTSAHTVSRHLLHSIQAKSSCTIAFWSIYGIYFTKTYIWRETRFFTFWVTYLLLVQLALQSFSRFSPSAPNFTQKWKTTRKQQSCRQRQSCRKKQTES